MHDLGRASQVNTSQQLPLTLKHNLQHGEFFVKNIRDLDIKNKKLLIRVDFNVPIDEQGNITDDIRIRGVLPTINHALDENARVIIISHMGRPRGQRVEKFSMAPAAKRLSRLIDKEVKLAHDCIGPEVKNMVDAMQAGEVIMLENLRFHPEEQANDEKFSRELASLADVYINDAFAVAHRAHASVVGIPRFVVEAAAGFLLQKEMDYFHRSVGNPMRPLVAIVGGAKVSSKLGALRNLMERVDKMVIGGAMANTFLKSLGHGVGQSKTEDELLDTARELVAQAGKLGVKLYLPIDCIVADKFDARAETKRVTTQEVPDEWMILDIGPATTMLFSEALDDAKTIIWNGPMGAFEMDAFSRGTLAMVQRLASSHALTIVGGGDTDVAVHRAGESNNISYISTGGGAFLMLMEGKELPGVTALQEHNRK
jgi:phosphoglycerate kinase